MGSRAAEGVLARACGDVRYLPISDRVLLRRKLTQCAGRRGCAPPVAVPRRQNLRLGRAVQYGVGRRRRFHLRRPVVRLYNYRTP
jgi:hypothetical protein